MRHYLTDQSVPEKRPKTKRLFLALLPDNLLIKQLARLQKNIPGRKTPPENLHMTLAFLGNQPDSVVSELADFLDRLEFSPFSLSLDKIGWFPKIRLGWIGPTTVSAALTRLHRITHRFLVPAYITDKKETFRPHITLARQSIPTDMKISEPVIWHVNRLALMQSILNAEPGQHPRYHILHETTAGT